MDVYAACANGHVKGIKLDSSTVTNYGLSGGSSPAIQPQLTHIAFADDICSQVICATVDHGLKLFDVTTSNFSDLFDVAADANDAIIGLAACHSKITVGFKNGGVKVRSETGKLESSISAGPNLSVVKHPEPDVIITGGKENPVKVWPVEACMKPTFVAKNVKDDWLGLRRPVWVKDVAMIPGSQKIVTVTGHKEVRLYDMKSGQKRPVIEVIFGDHPFTALTLINKESNVIGATTDGRMALFDLRGKGKLVHTYKGFAGTITCLDAHKELPYVASGGLDRFIRLHHIDDKDLLNNVYVKSQIIGLLMCHDLSIASKDTGGGNGDPPAGVLHNPLRDKESNEAGRPKGFDDDDDPEADLWDSLRIVTDQRTQSANDQVAENTVTDSLATSRTGKRKSEIRAESVFVSDNSTSLHRKKTKR